MKLKPAKQALADAIHQNGGWPKECHWMFAESNGFGGGFCWTNKPKRSGWNWLGGGKFTPCCEIGASIPNWHQCILSRDEYFTAYPEQVKIEIGNGTKHKVEVEMKSESEMTINASDWHKNGELPPVGAFVDVVGDSLIYGQGESNCEVIAHVENTAVIRMSYGLGCFESGAIIPARTERDKAIDEIISTAKKIELNSEMANQIIGEVAVELYEAGYRKEVK